MRSCHLLFSFITLCAITRATPQVNVSQIFSEIPSCALECISTELSSSEACTIADPTCLCANETLQANLSVCVQGACTQAELIPLAVANNQLCAGFPVQSRGSEAINFGVVFISITLPITFLRCWSRYCIAKQLWWDDWSIILAAITLVVILATDIIDVNLGFGEHIWEIQATNEIPLLKIFLFSEVLYILALTFTKVSILVFYLRIFRRSAFRITVMIIIGFVIASGIAFIFAIIFQCSPVAGAWDKSLSAKCVNVNSLAFANSGVSIAQDFIILILPVPELAGLQMSLRKKLSVIGMFGLGGFACITSIVRLKFIVSFGDSKDSTWDNVTPSVWSIIEICISMICACLPAIRALLNYWFPTLFEITKATGTAKTMSKNAANTNNTINSSAYREAERNWIMTAHRKQQGLEIDENIISMSDAPCHKKSSPDTGIGGNRITIIKDPDEIPPDTPLQTFYSSGLGSLESRSSTTTTRGSDEVEILEVRTAVPLRYPREGPPVPPKDPPIQPKVAAKGRRSTR